MSQRIIQGDSAQILKTIEDNSIDAVITDPPYGIEFLAKAWDRNTGAMEIWRECFRVLKPGGFLLAFSAARTYHQLATNIESVGFEIRDQIMWLYASGFPKAQDIGKSIQRRQGVKQTKAYQHNVPRNGGDGDTKHYENTGEVVPTSAEARQWSGWKTALKPAHEPICMARKPFRGSTIDNVLTHGVGALNIDATRIGLEKGAINPHTAVEYRDYSFGNAGEGNKQSNLPKKFNPDAKGRYPSNVVGEVEGYQKFFYCPKVSRRERHRGFEQEHIPDPLANYAQGDVKNHPLWDPSKGTNIQRLKHKIMEHNRDVGPNLDHIPTNPDGMYAKDENGEYKVKGRNYMYIAEQQRTKDVGPNLDHIPTDSKGKRYCEIEQRKGVGNNHPTVKPVELMKYLVKLVTPQGAHIIDPFAGSGTTGMAAKELGRQFTGIELDNRYCEIAMKRISATHEDKAETLFE